MSEFLRPDADDLDGLWTDQAAGTVLFAALDETVADDADFIRSASDPSADVARVRLSDPSGPVDTNAAVTVRYRYRKEGAGTLNITVRLKEGTTEIATWLHEDVAATFADAAQVLSAGQKILVSDWSNLFLEFQADLVVVGGFSPTDLFASGELGGIYIFDADNCYTDLAKTTNAAVDDAVYVVTNQLSGGADFVQGTAANRPILKRYGGGFFYVETDGLGDNFYEEAIFGGTSSTTYTIACAERVFSTSLIARPFWFRSNTSNKESFAAASDGSLRFNGAADTSGGVPPTVPYVRYATRNGDTFVDMFNETVDKNKTITGINPTFDDIAVEDDVFQEVVRVYAAVVINRVLTSTEGENLRQWLADQSGVTLGAFHPTQLYGTSEVGVCFEIHPDFCFTDTAMTTKAAVGDAVAAIQDRSGNGNHGLQSDATARAILRQTGGGLYYLEFDGINDTYEFGSPRITMQTMSAAHATQQSNGAQNIVWGLTSSATPKFGVVSSTRDFFFRTTNTALIDVNVTDYTAAPAVLLGTMNDGTQVGRYNGAQIGTDNDATIVDNSWDRLGSGSGGVYLNGDFYGGLMIARVLNSTEIDNLEAWLAAKSGVTL